MSCTSIFDHPIKGIYRYGFQKPTVTAEAEEARCYDGSQHFGRYLYSRPVGQVPIQVGSRYQFKTTEQSTRLRYRKSDEALFGPFDYFDAGGAQRDQVRLLVELSVPIPGLGVQAPVMLSLELTGARTFKFAELYAAHFFEVSLADGQAQLLGFRSESDSAPSVSIPLQLVGN